MKEIYISDLDNTLLDRHAVLPEYSKTLLNALMKEGLCFTVASARSPFSALPILKGLEIQYPLILLNGSLLYHPGKEVSLETTHLPKNSVARIIEASEKYSPHTLMVAEENNQILMQYFREDEEYWESLIDYTYFEEKKGFSKKILFSEEDYNKASTLYALFSFDEPAPFEECSTFLRNDKNITVDAYKDRYLENRWYIEIFSYAASKQYGIQRLQKLCSFDRWIAFGDGRNDLSMFRQCDEGIAVSNACDDLKNEASEIIGSNLENAVVNYIHKRFKRDNKAEEINIKRDKEI